MRIMSRAEMRTHNFNHTAVQSHSLFISFYSIQFHSIPFNFIFESFSFLMTCALNRQQPQRRCTPLLS